MKKFAIVAVVVLSIVAVTLSWKKNKSFISKKDKSHLSKSLTKPQCTQHAQCGAGKSCKNCYCWPIATNLPEGNCPNGGRVVHGRCSLCPLPSSVTKKTNRKKWIEEQKKMGEKSVTILVDTRDFSKKGSKPLKGCVASQILPSGKKRSCITTSDGTCKFQTSHFDGRPASGSTAGRLVFETTCKGYMMDVRRVATNLPGGSTLTLRVRPTKIR